MKKLAISVFSLILLSAVTFLMVTSAAGGADDPVVSLGYLNSVFKPEMQAEIKSQINAAKPEIITEVVSRIDSGEGTASSAEFVPVELLKGQKIRPLSGSIEVLLRTGAFKCIDEKGDKIPSITSGSDAKNGDSLALQNLYLIPRPDGRAITATTNSWVMVRGAYIIE